MTHCVFLWPCAPCIRCTILSRTTSLSRPTRGYARNPPTPPWCNSRSMSWMVIVAGWCVISRPMRLFVFFSSDFFFDNSYSVCVARPCLLQAILVGRPRPNFATECWPSPAPQNFYSVGFPKCTNGTLPDDMYRSFPSNHAAISFSVALAVCIVLISVSKPRMGTGWKMAGIATTLVLPLILSITRIQDGLNHPTDVIAGAILGCTATAVMAVYI